MIEMNERILVALRDAFLSRHSLESLPDAVWKRAGALNTWGTNAIEGNTLTRRDVEKLLLDEANMPGRPLRDVLETVQHEHAFRGLLARKDGPVTLETVLQLHEVVFAGSARADPGQWRRVNVRISGSDHRPPRYERVMGEMDAWRADYERRERAGEETFLLAAWMHQRFESVHPFSDGNGRVGRLLLNLHFMKRNWPPLHILPDDRGRYLDALEAGNRGDLGPLLALLRTNMARALIDLLDEVGTEQDELKRLGAFASKSGYGAHYLSLRAGQGELPAVKEKGRWQTSARAMALYQQHKARP